MSAPIDMQAVERALKASEDALKLQLKTQDAEIAKYGETTDQTAKAVKAAETRLDGVLDDLKGVSAKALEDLTEQLGTAKERIDELEAKGQRPGWPMLGDEELKTPGEMFTAEGDQAARVVSLAGRKTARVSIEVKSLFAAFEAKADFLSTAATRLVIPQRTDVVSPALRRLRIRDLIPVRTTGSNAVEYLEEIGFAATGAASGTQTHGAAAATAEGAALPNTQLEMTLKTAPVRDIGHHLSASRQVLNDMSQLRAYIDDRLIYGVGYAEEIQLLYGDGTGANLTGLLTNANRQQYAWSTGTTGDTKIDCLRRAMTKAHVAEYVPTGCVVNPTDWEDIQLIKGDDKHYIWLSVSNGTEDRLFRIPVVVTNAINALDALVGSFAIGATIWDRETSNVRVSEHHDTNFTERLVTILGEERIALTNYRPDAFVDVSFDAAPA